MQRTSDLIVLTESDTRVLGQEDFGVPGLVAHEWVGPYVNLQAVGPLIMVHDGLFEPHRGITHHPHRFNERLFYILEGVVEHDDALNAIQGRMETGDLGRLTEGARGMYHKEWNVTDDPARAFILVYGTEPVPPRASFEVLRDADAPRYREEEGVRTKELVGPRAGLPLHGDVRRFSDSIVDAGAEVLLELGEGEGGLVFPLEGEMDLDGERLGVRTMAVLPPGLDPRSPRIVARSNARVLRVVFGLGDGLFVRSV